MKSYYFQWGGIGEIGRRIFSFCPGFLIFGVVMAALSLLIRSPGIGGELRPYDLPSQRPELNRPYQQRPQYPQGVDESVYEDFAQQVRNLDQAKRNELIKAFSQKLDQAVSSNRWEEIKHYNRLLDILRSKK